MGFQGIDKRMGINPRAYRINYTVFSSIRVEYFPDSIKDRLLLKFILLDCLNSMPVFLKTILVKVNPIDS
jgi:hypothetical protein